MRVNKLIAVATVVFLAPAGMSCARDDAEPGAEQSPATENQREFPTTHTGEFLQIREGEPGSGKRVVVGSKLKSQDGTQADIKFTFTDAPPTQGGSIKCGGKTYDATGRLDQSKTAEGTIVLGNFGTLELDIERNLGVIVDKDAPPFCDEWEGKWTGAGNLNGERGTFLLVGFYEGDTAESTLTIKRT